MIVISHSWEFIPKGSSHFNYHVNSAKSTTASKNAGNQTYINFHQNRLYNNHTFIDENRSINESYFLQGDQTFLHELKEKWHLKQVNDYSEEEIYMKDGTVIISSGSDFESKIIKKSYSFDSPIIEANWFNFRSDLNDNDIIKDALCIFELQKMHVYFPNGSDFHINLSFKLKNCWKLKDGILLERYQESDHSLINPFKPKQFNPVLYSLSHPLNEIKPVMCRFSNNESAKTTYWRENCKQVIVDVIEKYDLILVYNRVNNVHCLYRISDFIYSDDPDFILSPESQNNPPQNQTNINNNTKTPVTRANSASCLSKSLNQSSKRRLSVSPIISSLGVFNNKYMNTPLPAANVSSLATGPSTNNQHHHPSSTFYHKNFSPMAALSRSPSCSSSPAMFQIGGQNSGSNHHTHRRSIAGIPITLNNSNTTINYNTSANPVNNIAMTPSIEMSNYNNCKTPLNNVQQTPLHNQMSNMRGSYTPHIANGDLLCDNSSLYADQQPLSEYQIEFLWSEQSNDFAMNEKASKFFYMIDLYNQKYICYLVRSKSQLRCLKIEYNLDRQIIPVGTLSLLQAKDAVFVEARNLMVIIDLTGNLVIYSGLAKLCKIHLQNTLSKQLSINPNSIIKSPFVSPIKLKLTNLIDESVSSNEGDSIETAACHNLVQNTAPPDDTKTNNFLLPLSIQNDFSKIFDSSGSRFTVSLNNNRHIRININEISTCKLVQMCLEAFKSTLNKDIYYEIIQQWFIHRFTITESLNDQLSLFLYLIVNLSGCFDMQKLESEMSFLFSFQKNGSKSSNDSQNDSQNDTTDDNMEMYTEASSQSQPNSAKRAKCNYEGIDTDWEQLLNSDFVTKSSEFADFEIIRTNQSTKPKKSNQKAASTTRNTSGILYPYLKNILYTLHLIYEESKLYRSLKIYLQPFVQVLYLFAQELHLTHYISYYEQEYPLLISLSSSFSKQQQQQQQPVLQRSNSLTVNQNSNMTSTPSSNTLNTLNVISTNSRAKNSSTSQLTYIIAQEPPNLHKFLIKLADYNHEAFSQKLSAEETPNLLNPSSKSSIQNPFPVIPKVSVRTIKAIKIYALLSLFSKPNLKISYKEYIEQMMLKINLTGFQQPSLHKHEYNFDNFKSNRYEIYKNIFTFCLDMSIASLDELYDYSYSILFPLFEAIHYARENPSLDWPASAFDLIGRNDLSFLKSSALATRENADLLAKNKLSSDDELTLPTIQAIRKEEEDGMAHLFTIEALKCRFSEDLRMKEVRSCLQTTKPIQIKLTQGPDVSDHDFVEEEEKFLFAICQRTMSLPIARGILTLHTINPIPTEPVQIPELNLKGKSITKKTTIDLTRIEVPQNMTYWPLFHNGVAAGLTIHSQARDLSNAWIKSHLAKNFELTNEQAGFLYGLGLTGHLANFSMLNVHDALTRRHDLTNISILLGLAASKISSMDINVIRLISMHIRALMPPVEIELEIPYNIQIAALLSLGLVYAKSGNKHISYVLLKEIGRLPGHEVDRDVHSFDREAYSLSAGLALGLVLLEKGKESLTIMDSTFTDELYHYMVGGHKEKYHEVNGAPVNPSFSTAIFGSGGGGNSGAGASGSNGNGIASSINGGDNFASSSNHLNYSKSANSAHIREGESINTNVTSPGATLALGLIYFNTCDKSIAEWFASPDSIYLLDSIRPDFLLLRVMARNLIMWKHIVPTEEWVIGQLPNILKNSFKIELNINKKFSKMNISSVADEGDEESEAGSQDDANTKTEAFRHIIAGACMSIGLKFAGTMNNDAYHTLLHWVNYFIELNDQKLSTENCFCVVVLSLAMVMAGSGDLEVLRICRHLRSRVGPTQAHVLYGSHMAVNMALSLLFMGGGHYTLKTDSLSVALMICAFYPHFPIDSNDNRFHLQAFRHLYVLASEARLLLSKDVDSNECCYVPVEITLKANENHGLFKYNQMTPCMLPELDKIQELKILGPRYYSIKFNEEHNFVDLRNILNSELYVKQKNGYFSYSDDPKDEKAFNIRNFLNKIIVPRQITPELLESITNEEHINLFAKILNKSQDKLFNDKTNRLLKIIYESVIQETFDFVGVILLLDKEANEEPNSLLIQEIKLIDTFYRIVPQKLHHIINQEFLISVKNTLQTKIRKLLKANPGAIKSYLSGDYCEEVENLIHFCVLYDINKQELIHFSTYNDLSEMLKVRPNSSVRPEKLLILHQTINKNRV